MRALRCGWRGITRTGSVTSAGGVAATDPEVTFDPGAEALPNRVDGPTDSRTALNRWRIKTITTESGGQTQITYSPVSDCSRSNLPTPATNTTRCMPVFYAPNGTPTLDWFHKYVVTRVDLDDTATDQLNQITFYDYLDTPAWHYNTDEITKDKYRPGVTGAVTAGSRSGQGDPVRGSQTATEYHDLRGMDGGPGRVQSGGDEGCLGRRQLVADGSRTTRHFMVHGAAGDHASTDPAGAGGVVDDQRPPAKTDPPATRTRNGITGRTAWLVDTAVERTRNGALAAGGSPNHPSRPTRSPTVTACRPQSKTSRTRRSPATRSCTCTTYARNDATLMIDNVAQHGDDSRRPVLGARPLRRAC